MKGIFLTLIIFSLSPILFSGCFSDSKSSSGVSVCAEPSLDITGNWASPLSGFSYTLNGINYNCTMSITATQTGSAISGSSSMNCGDGPSTSQYTATICGNSINGSAVSDDDASISRISATGSNTEMNMSFSGNSDTSSWYGTGILTKQ